MRRLFLRVLFAIMVCLFGAVSVQANTTTITFDVDASGNPLVGSDIFERTDPDPLIGLYLPLGVTIFSNPGFGGALLSDANLSHPARSGRNVLAFAPLPISEYAYFPETIAFSRPIDYVEIWMSSGDNNIAGVLMTAYDYSNNNLGTGFANAGSEWSKLSIASPGIRKVVLEEIGIFGFTLFDDLTFHTQVPEPATLLLLGSGLVGLIGYGRKKLV